MTLSPSRVYVLIQCRNAESCYKCELVHGDVVSWVFSVEAMFFYEDIVHFCSYLVTVSVTGEA